MTEIPLPWWAETDRRKLQSACRAICQEQGILAIIGDDFAGRSQAALIAERELDRCGCAVVSLRLHSQRANDSRQVLRELTVSAERLQAPVPGSISAGVTATSYTDSGLFEAAADELRRFHTAMGKPLGVLVYDLDEAVPSASLAILRRLADRLGGAWVLVGSQRVNWHRVQPRKRHILNQFVRDDVAGVLRSAVTDSLVTAEVTEAILQDLFGVEARRSALDVYSALKFSEVGLSS